MVKFRKPFNNYNKGDVAGFSKSHEDFLVNRGIADRHEKEAEVAKSGEKTVETKDPSKPQTRQTTVGPQTRK